MQYKQYEDMRDFVRTQEHLEPVACYESDWEDSRFPAYSFGFSKTGRRWYQWYLDIQIWLFGFRIGWLIDYTWEATDEKGDS